MPDSPELPQRSHVETTDPEYAHEWLRTAYRGHSARLSGNRETFRFSNTVYRAGLFDVSRLVHSMTVEGEGEPTDAVMVGHVHRGRIRHRIGRDEACLTPGRAVLTPPGHRSGVWWEDIETSVLRLDLAEVERAATEQFGLAAGGLRFDATTPLSPALERHWLGLLRYVTHAVLPNPAAVGSALIRAETCRQLCVTLLHTFPNTALAETPAAGRVPPAAMRRALAFIDGNAGSAITLTDIAGASGVAPRALQHAFRRHLQTTPTAYLRQVRLDRAHRELQAADPASGASVAAIAARWGFTHLGRFAASYRTAYGQPPNQTLRT